MNSTLPNFSAVPVPATGAAPLNAAALADLGSLAAPASPPPGEFADLLATNPAAAGVVVPPPTAAATAACPTVVLAPTTSAAFAAAEVARAAEPVASVDEPEAIPDTGDPAPVISRDTLEQAASFAAAFVQALWPELAPAPVATDAPAGPRADGAVPAFSSPVQTPGAEPGTPELPGATAKAASLPPTEATATAPASPATPGFEVALAADGAFELKLDRAAGATDADAAPAPSAAIELQAELEMPGRAVLRLEAAGERPQDFAGFTGEAKIAGKNPTTRAAAALRSGASERNFVVTGDKQVKAALPEAGIAVAQRDPIMSAAPIEETRATRSTDSLSVGTLRADFQVVPPPAERITAPAAAPAGQNFAERAVTTVTSLVDAQFTASMQKSGSVNLRLKFGGEDLSVRVELRGGAVHTDFQTDSPELRAALTREWQALTSSAPAESRRFLDPVFSPAAPSTATGDGHSQSSGRQAQQQAAQQDLPQRSPREFSENPAPFARRSLLSETFSPAPLEPRTPAFLPTSLRLSALA